MKKIAALVLIAFLGMSGIALADSSSDKVADLEKKIAEMSGMVKAMQDEIATLKGQKTEAPKAEAPKAAAPAGAVAVEPPGEWAKRVTLSGQVRFRGYDVENIWDFDDDKDVDYWNTLRTYGSLKATVKATDDITAVVQTTAQTWGDGVTNAKQWEENNKSDKMFLDNAYISAKNLFGCPVDVIVGRQNLTYGSGFVIFDGKSNYASTTNFFDGVKLSWRMTANTALDMLYMSTEENNRDDASGDDTNLKGAYFTASKTPVVGKSELYVLNRYDQILNKDIWMYGGRISNKLENGFDYYAEAALQTGDALTDVDQDAWGGKAEAGYTFKKSSMTPRLYGGLAYLSGDDSSTEDNEGWDVFYGGWGGGPQFGDLLAFILLNVPNNSMSGIYNYNKLSSLTGEVVFGNFQMYAIGASIVPVKDLTLGASYHNLKFNETNPGVSDDFGDYYQTSLKYQFNKNFSFSLYGAFLSPGDAFSHTAQDTAKELYWETNFTF